MWFNAGDAVMQYCNGTDWIAMLPPGAASETVACTDTGPWTAHQTGTATMLMGVAYGDGIFAGVSFDNVGGRTISSSDGTLWSDMPQPGGAQWTAVTYGNGLFVAVAHWSGVGYVMTSPDGINWTAQAGTSGDWRGVTYGNGLFVAVERNTTDFMTSPDGIVWTAGTLPASGWSSVIYGNGTFVAVGAGKAITSPDGINWTASGSTGTWADWQSVAYGNGLFVAVAGGSSGSGLDRLMTSPDGTTWTRRDAPEVSNWQSVTYGNGLFVAVANGGTNRVMSSPDGINWTMQAAAEANDWRSVTYGRGVFVAVSYDGTNAAMTAACLRPGCANPTAPAGVIIYNKDHRVLQWCDGTNWRAAGPVSPSGPETGCVSPAGTGGNLVFNVEYRTLQYCDGADWIAIGKPCRSCGGLPTEKVAFYTLAGVSGRFIGGISGADQLCQDQAKAVGLGGTYKAWIADSNPASAPATRFTHAAVPYVRVDGTKIADDWTDLTDGTLDSVMTSETGYENLPVNGVWSNVLPDGTQASGTATDHCDDWGTGGSTGRIGHRDRTDSTWTEFATITCFASDLLYCFEQ